jgi:ParB family chromosome partitioning protein
LHENPSEALIERQEAIRHRLDEVERQLASYVGFDETQKMLAGCYVSIGQDGTPFFDQGLVKPEHRKQLAKLLKEDDGSTSVHPKPKLPLPESLRRDLAVYRSQIAQVEIARHPAIALDLLAFHLASKFLDDRRDFDGPQIEFKRPKPNSRQEATVATRALEAIEKSLPAGWCKPASEAARFDAFRSLPEATRLEFLAYCLALTLQPKLAPAQGDEATAYDAALALTQASVADYWRPGKESYFRRISRDQLLALGRDMLGNQWAQSHLSDKKAELVDQLDRAFADPAKHGRTPEQLEKLKSWLPTGMAFATAPTPKPAKTAKARKAA